MAGPAGYYAVDDAPYLRYWDGAVFDPYFWYDDVVTVDTTALIPSDSVWDSGRRTELVNDPASPMYGFYFISSQNRIYVFVNRVHTYTIVKDGTVNGTPWGMCYDSNHPNRIYFNLAFGTAPGTYYSDFNGTTFSDITLANKVGGIATGSCTTLIFNPVNGHKYIGGPFGIFDIDATDTVVGVMNEADVLASALALGITIVGGWLPDQYWQVDSNGNLWVTQYYVGGKDTTGVADIIVIDGSLSFGAAGTNSANLVYVIDLGADGNTAGPGLNSRLGPQIGRLGYYPGDGTPGSERMIVFGSLDAVGNPTTTGEFYAYDNNAVIQTGGWVVDPRFNENSIGGNINSGGLLGTFYSGVNNALLFFNWTAGQQWLTTSGAFIENVDDNGFGAQGGAWPQYNLSNGEIVFPAGSGAFSAATFTYITPSTGTIACGDGGITKMYIGTAGPYTFNDTLLQWDPVCTVTYSAATPSPTQFTVTAVLDNAIVTQAALIYSTDYGFTWNTATDSSGNLYANTVTWATGRVYNNIAGLTNIKVSFTTVSDCGLESANIITYIT